jgi:hypothetical protein
MNAQGEDGRREVNGPGGPALTRVQRAHRKIVGLVSELEEAQDRARISPLLSELSSILPDHFADEEGVDGLFEQLRIQRPEIHSRLKSIQREHRSLLQGLQALQAKVDEEGLDPERIEEEKAAFVRRLRGHERTENLVVLDVYLEDEGGSGASERSPSRSSRS